ncbi:MAG: hypothetical protein ACXIUL_05660 [Wenzhouxiangella sp.]
MLRLALLLLAGLWAGQSIADDQFLIETRLWLGGELAGTPTVIARAGEPATLERLGEPQFRLTLTVEAVQDRFAPTDTLWLTVEVETPGEEGWEAMVDTLLGVQEGRTASFSVVDGDDEATPETARLFLEVKPSRLRPADRLP